MVEFRTSIQNSVLVVAHGGRCLLLMLMLILMMLFVVLVLLMMLLLLSPLSLSLLLLLLLLLLPLQVVQRPRPRGYILCRCVWRCCKYGFGWCFSKFRKTMQLLEKHSIVEQSYQRLFRGFICFSWFFFICFNVFSKCYQLLKSRLQSSCIYPT